MTSAQISREECARDGRRGIIDGLRVEGTASLLPCCKFDGDFFFKMAAPVSCVFLMLIAPHYEAQLPFFFFFGLAQR